MFFSRKRTAFFAALGTAALLTTSSFASAGAATAGLPGPSSSVTVLGTPGLNLRAPSASTTYLETTGGVTHTWTNYKDAGGLQGPVITKNKTVRIACRTVGFEVQDGNTWWYRIASSPWDARFYASADAFYNNGATSGSLVGTPWYDPRVSVCRTPASVAHLEITGGVTHTWTNYADAGGTEGPSIAGNVTVEIACRISGWKAPDGNTWWYKLAPSPWNGRFYASADAFYNNGATSGSLVGTPWYDPLVPVC